VPEQVCLTIALQEVRVATFRNPPRKQPDRTQLSRSLGELTLDASALQAFVADPHKFASQQEAWELTAWEVDALARIFQGQGPAGSGDSTG